MLVMSCHESQIPQDASRIDVGASLKPYTTTLIAWWLRELSKWKMGKRICSVKCSNTSQRVPVSCVMADYYKLRLCVEKCPSGWHHYEKTSSCYKVYERGENYWQAGETCLRVNGSLATFSTNEELQFILKIDQRVCERRDQCRSVFTKVLL